MLIRIRIRTRTSTLLPPINDDPLIIDDPLGSIALIFDDPRGIRGIFGAGKASFGVSPYKFCARASAGAAAGAFFPAKKALSILLSF